MHPRILKFLFHNFHTAEAMLKFEWKPWKRGYINNKNTAFNERG